MTWFSPMFSRPTNSQPAKNQRKIRIQITELENRTMPSSNPVGSGVLSDTIDEAAMTPPSGQAIINNDGVGQQNQSNQQAIESAPTAIVRTLTWTGNGGNRLWSNPANWAENTTPADGDNLIFASGASEFNPYNDLAPDTLFHEITFSADNYNVSGNRIRVDSSINMKRIAGDASNARADIFCDIALAKTITLDVTESLLVIAGQISGNYGVDKIGSGRVTYNNELGKTGLTNTYTGNTSVKEGRLSLARGPGIQCFGGNLIVGGFSSEATFKTFDSDLIPDAASISSGTKSSIYLNENETINNIFMSGGSIIIDDLKTISIAGKIAISPSSNGNSSSISSGIIDLMNNNSFSFDVSDTPDATYGLRISSDIINGGIVKTGSGIIEVSGNNSFDGDVLITSGGIEAYRNDTALGSPVGKTTINSGASLFVYGDRELTEDITVSGDGFDENPALQGESGEQTLSGDITLAGDTTIGAIDEGFLTISGDIMESVGNSDLTVNISDNSQIKFTGTASYTGETKVKSGKFLVHGSIETSSMVTVDPNATLGGTGTLPAVSLAATAVLAPGDNTNKPLAGILNTYDFDFASGSIFDAQINGKIAGADYDQLNVVGKINLNNAILKTNFGNNLTPGTSYVLIHNDGTDPVIGTFFGLAEGSQVKFNSNTFVISYHGGDGNDVVLSQLAPTFTLFVADSSVVLGDDLTLNAQVKSAAGSVTGTVEFYDLDNNVLIGKADLDASGNANFTLPNLMLGQHQFKAKYLGQDQLLPSESAPITVSVIAPTADIQLAISDPSVTQNLYGDTITLTAVVSTTNKSLGNRDGKVEFRANGKIIGITDVNPIGTATLAINNLSASVFPYQFTAKFIPNNQNISSKYSTQAVSRTVQKATLTVKANNISREYGEINPELTFSIEGFKNGEKLNTSDVSGTPTLSTTATQGSSTSDVPYPISIANGTLKSNNYQFQFTQGNLTVTKEIVERPVIDTRPATVVDVLPISPREIEGAPITRLTAHITDTNYQSIIGIAITSAPSSPSTGRWEYSVNSGGNWYPITGVSKDNALLLTDASANRIRFKPNGNYTGFSRLEYAAWNGKADLPTNGSNPSYGNTLVGTAYSLNSETAIAAVGKTSPLIDIQGNVLLSQMSPNQLVPAENRIKSLLGGLVSDKDNSKIGIAITSIDSSHGKWQYRVSATSSGQIDNTLKNQLRSSEKLADVSAKWITITSVSKESALLLGPNDLIRFVPDQDFEGEAKFVFNAWDRSIGQSGDRGTLPSTAFSLDEQSAAVKVPGKPKVDLTVPQVLTNSTATVSMLLNNVVTNAKPADRLGIAVTAISGNGIWSYQIGTNPAVALKIVPNTATLIPSNAVLKFTPRAGATGSATLAYRVWNASTLPANTGSSRKLVGPGFGVQTEILSLDIPSKNGFATPVIGQKTITLSSIAEDSKLDRGSLIQSLAIAAKMSGDQKHIVLTDLDNANGTWQYFANSNAWADIPSADAKHGFALESTARIRFVPNANFNGQSTLKFKGWNGTNGTSGDILDTTSGTAFSSDIVTASILVTPINDAPQLDNSKAIYLPAITAGGTSASIAADKLLATTNDVDTPSKSLGVYVTGFSGPGKWQYSNDGRQFSDLNNTTRYFSNSVSFRFVGSPNKSGLASLSYRAWDGTSKRADSLSIAIERVTLEVGNTSPSLKSPGVLTSHIKNAVNNPGDRVGSFLGNTFVDTKGSLVGIAVTNVSNADAGEWQRSLDNGKTWVALKDVSDKSALLLPDSAKIRFLPDLARVLKNAGASTFENPVITYKAWDRTVGDAGELIDTTDAGLNAFSNAVASTVAVDAIARSVNIDNRKLQTIDEAVSLNIGQLIKGTTLAASTTKLGIAVIGFTGNGTWEYSNDHFATPGKKITNVSNTKSLLLSDSTSIRFIPSASFDGVATLSYKAWDMTNSNLKDSADTTQSAVSRFFSSNIELLQVNVSNHPPILNRL